MLNTLLRPELARLLNEIDTLCHSADIHPANRDLARKAACKLKNCTGFTGQQVLASIGIHISDEPHDPKAHDAFWGGRYAR